MWVEGRREGGREGLVWREWRRGAGGVLWWLWILRGAGGKGRWRNKRERKVVALDEGEAGDQAGGRQREAGNNETVDGRPHTCPAAPVTGHN